MGCWWNSFQLEDKESFEHKEFKPLSIARLVIVMKTTLYINNIICAQEWKEISFRETVTAEETRRVIYWNIDYIFV